MNCVNCNKETTNAKFCSKSCAAVTNNKLNPKRKLTKTCHVEGCSSVVKTYRHTKCSAHWDYYLANKHCNKTLGEFRGLQSVRGKHVSWSNVHIRQHARSQHKDILKLPCAHCGYSKHVELCHIKPVASFPNEALLSEVNSSTNVIQLCRNCHWELDHC